MAISWLHANWPAPGHIKAATTLREGGISLAPYRSLNLATHVEDNPQHVKHNRSLLDTPSEPGWLEQVHSTEVIQLPADGTRLIADASYTVMPNVVCVVMTADCLPVLITDAAGTCVAAIHAGWRGLCDGILEITITALPVEASQLLVWLGPAIGPDAYEVGDDVYQAFVAHDKDAASAFKQNTNKRWLLDLYSAARQRLAQLGVTRVYGGEHCTFTEKEKFYSYRRDGLTGRMASLIWIEPG